MEADGGIEEIWKGRKGNGILDARSFFDFHATVSGFFVSNIMRGRRGGNSK